MRIRKIYRPYQPIPAATTRQCTCQAYGFDPNCPRATDTERINMAAHYEHRERAVELTEEI